MRKFFWFFILFPFAAFAQTAPQVVDTVNTDGSVTRVITLQISPGDYLGEQQKLQTKLQNLQNSITAETAQVNDLQTQLSTVQTNAQASQAALATLNTLAPANDAAR